jgi:hypothetical protein
MTQDLTVVGGSYGEECCFPRHSTYRGSGFRAAITLSGLSGAVTLHTVTGPALSEDFSDLANINEFAITATRGADDIWFRYRHPLARPEIYPPNPRTQEQPSISADLALVFGMLEGRPKVEARRAVYDPQDGFRAQAFSANGSSANELVVLASISEGRAITGKDSPEEIAADLLRNHGCRAVVLKCGPQGALVATDSLRKWVRAFQSKRVWKIGSGDIFSAAFAHAWLREDLPPLEAAWFASRFVAEYVETRNERMSDARLLEVRKDAERAMPTSKDAPPVIPKAKIYLAGPFFSTSEQWQVDEARDAFRELGFSVFSPIHEIGEGPASVVAPADLYELQNSQLVFALLDTLDAGTFFEVGYARALGIPVIGVAEALPERPLTMLLGSGCGISNDFTTGIYSACWELMGNV